MPDDLFEAISKLEDFHFPMVNYSRNETKMTDFMSARDKIGRGLDEGSLINELCI